MSSFLKQLSVVLVLILFYCHVCFCRPSIVWFFLDTEGLLIEIENGQKFSYNFAKPFPSDTKKIYLGKYSMDVSAMDLLPACEIELVNGWKIAFDAQKSTQKLEFEILQPSSAMNPPPLKPATVLLKVVVMISWGYVIIPSMSIPKFLTNLTNFTYRN